MDERRRRSVAWGDLVTGLILLGATAVGAWSLLGNETLHEFDFGSDPGPALVPSLLLALLAVSATALALGALAGSVAADSETAAGQFAGSSADCLSGAAGGHAVSLRSGSARSRIRSGHPRVHLPLGIPDWPSGDRCSYSRLHGSLVRRGVRDHRGRLRRVRLVHQGAPSLMHLGGRSENPRPHGGADEQRIEEEVRARADTMSFTVQ